MTDECVGPALDPMSLHCRTGSSYPGEYKQPCAERIKRVLGEALGLTHYGVNLVELPPGAWSAQRHWHTREEEFVLVLEGELNLVTDSGEQTLRPGMCAGFPAGVQDGHHLVNKSSAAALYLEIGDRNPEDECHYPDIDLFLPGHRDGQAFTHKNGDPYQEGS